MKLREGFVTFLKGLFIGIADIIPGISGGTIALIVGIYERLIHSISKIDFRFILYFLKGDLNKANKNIRNIDFELFIPLIGGIGSALWFMSHLIYFLLQNFPAIINSFFFGLILASAGLIYKKGYTLSVKNISLLAIGFLFAFLFVGLATLQIGHSLPVIFLSGAIAICAMILPGISGAFMLLFLGQYTYMLSVLKNLQFLEIFVFCSGALIGILFFSKFVDYLLSKHKIPTLFFLIGLMLGALRLPFQNIMSTIDSVFPVLISGILGFSIVFVLEMKPRKLTKISQSVR